MITKLCTLLIFRSLSSYLISFEKAVGATSTGLHYLLTKAMIETATALNVCQYLLIKKDQVAAVMNDSDNIMDGQDGDNIKNHPVISRLNQLNHLSGKLDSRIESKVEGLTDQLENLVKASALMSGAGEIESDGDRDGDDQPDEDADINSVEERDDEKSVVDDIDEESTASSSDEEDDQIVRQKQLMNEARFALRSQDDADIADASTSKRRRRRALPTFSDFGDDDEVNEDDIAAASKSLATTINRISQRSKSSSKPGVSAEANDEDDEDRFKRGLEMMNTELGDDDSDDNSGDDLGEGADIDDADIDDDGDDFYAQIKKKSEAKKEYKKKLYEVAPKYPGMDHEIEGERPLGQKIMKNRGLVAHKNKLSRNPRVKKREQYRKALIKRKGAVREVRTEEGHKYGGEATGIKSNISRSRKLGVK
jgi:U3 small nucleolar RNA-associated protein 3